MERKNIYVYKFIFSVLIDIITRTLIKNNLSKDNLWFTLPGEI